MIIYQCYNKIDGKTYIGRKFPFSKEHIQHLSESLKGNKNALNYKHTEDTKKRMSEMKRGKPLTKEHIQKILESRKNNKRG